MRKDARVRVMDHCAVILAGVMKGIPSPQFIFIIDFALRRAIGRHKVDLGFTLMPRRSSLYPIVAMPDLDFADDISLLWWL